MTYKLSLYVYPETTIGIAHLWNEALSSILFELRMDYGYGTAPDNGRSGVTSAGDWYVFHDLDPREAGELGMTVMEETPPHHVTYQIDVDSSFAQRVDYVGLLARVGQKFRDDYWVRWEVGRSN